MEEGQAHREEGAKVALGLRFGALGLSLVALFWVFALNDFACSRYGGHYCTGYLVGYLGVERFGLFGGAVLLTGVLVFFLSQVKPDRLGAAFLKTGMLFFTTCFLFETGIGFTDGGEWKLQLTRFQSSYGWMDFLTNEFLFWLSLVMVYLFCIAYAVISLRGRRSIPPGPG